MLAQVTMKVCMHMQYSITNSPLQVRKQQQIASGNILVNSINLAYIGTSDNENWYTHATHYQKHNIKSINLICRVHPQKKRRQVSEKSFDLNEGI